MCGILGVKVNAVTPELVANMKKVFTNQEHRGKIGCGVARQRNGILQRLRGTTASQLFEDKGFISFWQDLKPGDLVIGHHRYATTGGNGYCTESNHPVANENKNLMLVHNGHISGYTKVHDELRQSGHKFETEIRTMTNSGFVLGADITDSEVLVHLLEGGLVEDTINRMKNLNGSYAIAFLKANAHRIYLYRETSPIQVYEDKAGNIYFSSERPKEAEFINHVTLKEGVLYAIGGSGLKYVKKVKDISTYSYSGYGNGQTKLKPALAPVKAMKNPYNYDDDDDYGDTDDNIDKDEADSNYQEEVKEMLKEMRGAKKW